MKNSIRSRLLFGLTSAIVTLWIGMIAATYFGAQREVGALFDTQLEQSARVATRTMFGFSNSQNDADGLKEKYKKNLVVQVWNNSGELVVKSQNSPDFPLDKSQSGFGSADVDGQRWRTFSFIDRSNNLFIRAGEPYITRDYLTRHVLVQTLYPVIIGLPLVAFLIWFMVGRGFRPMKRLVAEVHRRDSHNMDQIEADYAPTEVGPLVSELNVLLGRLKDKMDTERHFIGDAAHELRTPLSGLKAQAEVALGARTPAERDSAINNILTGVDRASHLVNQLLTLSRLDETVDSPTGNTNLRETLQQVLIDLLPAADKKSIELSLQINDDGPLSVRGHSDSLYVLIRNLVDNAIKYSPSQSEVEVEVFRDAGMTRVVVKDHGSGIPPSDYDKVFDRFHRRANTNAYGSGLGLSIAKRVVELHGGYIILRETQPSPGLTIEAGIVSTVSDAVQTVERHTTRSGALNSRIATS
jgi:two-component system, OmpR family, sensor histidine kinase QseC